MCLILLFVNFNENLVLITQNNPSFTPLSLKSYRESFGFWELFEKFELKDYILILEAYFYSFFISLFFFSTF